ncbi:MAG TPA: DUF2911 domain-containing protein [Verrucomicrobiae bacterium]|jgi:hypothetical protein|nr:DUF2911 domain-containing protein [Verrucomicrobiae bacterium]
MNTKTLLLSLALGTGVLLSTSAPAQQTARLDFPSPSPLSTLKQRVGLTDIEIVYSRPSAKGRPVFGGLVPYGQVWRTGANGSTTISFSTPVKLNGTDIPAGKYSLFTIPGESEWTVIINKDTKSSPFAYNASNDVARVTVPAVDIAENVETFGIMIDAIRDDSALIELIWEHTAVPIHLTLNLVDTLEPQIGAAMSAPGDKKPYYQAAMFYYDHDLDLQKAKTWIEAAAKGNETYYVVNLKAKILAKLGDKEGAIAAAKRSSELAAKTEGASGYVKLNQDLIDSLQ